MNVMSNYYFNWLVCYWTGCTVNIELNCGVFYRWHTLQAALLTLACCFETQRKKQDDNNCYQTISGLSINRYIFICSFGKDRYWNHVLLSQKKPKDDEGWQFKSAVRRQVCNNNSCDEWCSGVFGWSHLGLQSHQYKTVLFVTWNDLSTSESFTVPLAKMSNTLLMRP